MVGEGGDWSATARLVLERYDRQLRLQGWDQSKIQAATVLIAGVGALGCEVSKNLALMGIGKLVLVDNDVVELSNLSRQMLFADSDIGMPKSVVAERRLREMNPHVATKALNGDVRQLSQELFKDVDVICACVDNWPTRRWLNSLAVELGKPLVDVAMEGFYANVQVIIPGKTACIECHGDSIIPKEVQVAECTLRKRKPEDLVNELKQHGVEISMEHAQALFKAGIKTVFDIKYTPQASMSELDGEVVGLVNRLRKELRPKMPALQSVAAAISGIASVEVVKLLHQGSLGKPFSGLIIYDALAARSTRVPLKRNRECFVCGDYVKTSGITIHLKSDETVLDLKEILASSYMYPDAEIQHRTRLLADDVRLSELTIEADEVLYIHTTRRAQPLALKVVLDEDSDRR
ncbi:MAG: ThiF family adenylyltransferase [Aigarchaeota archaeon]|nr:ThiF family adenylyltransferase [Candidatus Pelearchaeum maunauluense]